MGEILVAKDHLPLSDFLRDATDGIERVLARRRAHLRRILEPVGGYRISRASSLRIWHIALGSPSKLAQAERLLKRAGWQVRRARQPAKSNHRRSR